MTSPRGLQVCVHTSEQSASLAALRQQEGLAVARPTEQKQQRLRQRPQAWAGTQPLLPGSLEDVQEGSFTQPRQSS